MKVYRISPKLHKLFLPPKFGRCPHFSRLKVIVATRPAFAFVTYGLCHGNGPRMLANALRSKNIIVQRFMQIRGPASDGALLLPTWMKMMFKYAGHTSKKIDKFVKVVKAIKSHSKTRSKPKMPLSRWYLPLNAMIDGSTCQSVFVPKIIDTERVIQSLFRIFKV